MLFQDNKRPDALRKGVQKDMDKISLKEKLFCKYTNLEDNEIKAEVKAERHLTYLNPKNNMIPRVRSIKKLNKN